MIHIALFEPEIPPNTGNIIRLCANIKCGLHLIHPLGFSLDEKQLKRAGLDYHDITDIKEHSNYDDFIAWASARRIFACSTKGKYFYHQVDYHNEDVFLFGPESRGLPIEILQTFKEDKVIRIPMQLHSRSLNLSNSAAVIAYEATRQLGFAGML